MSATRLAGRLPGRRAFITGGGSGLGAAIATVLARDGWTLGLLDRDRTRLAPVEAALRGAGARAVHTYAADVTDEAAFGAAVDAFAAAAGGLDVMVNNAGVASAGAVATTPLADWRWTLETNVLGVVIGCRAALPHLERAGAGLLINVASAAAFAAAPEMATYNVSKAAVVTLTETLAAELEGTGVRVLVVMPGFFRTRLLETMRAPAGLLEIAGRLMGASRTTAEAVAEGVLAAAAAGRLHAVLPGSYAWLWRLKRAFPAFFARVVVGRRVRRALGAGGGSTART